MDKLKERKALISVLLLVIFYGVGLTNVLLGNGESIMRLSYMNLIISSVILFINHKIWYSDFAVKIIIVGVLGYFIEVTGVKTGMLFGEYTYGESLGFKVLDVPLIMAVNWMILCYLSLSFGVRLFKNNILSVAFAGGLMTLLDVFIEPVAIKYDFWMWFQNGVASPAEIPLQNYLMWFIFAVALNFILVSDMRRASNKVWPYLLAIMTVFFVTLNLI